MYQEDLSKDPVKSQILYDEFADDFPFLVVDIKNNCVLNAYRTLGGIPNIEEEN